MRSLLLPILLFVILGLGLSARPTAIPQPPETDDMKKLKERVDDLEKAVIENPTHPQQTVLARLVVVEDDVKDLQKAGDAVAKTGLKEADSLRKTLVDLDNDTRQLDKRLKLAEDQLRKGVGGEVAPDVRDLSKTVNQLDRTVDDLKERVKRLEAKK